LSRGRGFQRAYCRCGPSRQGRRLPQRHSIADGSMGCAVATAGAVLKPTQASADLQSPPPSPGMWATRVGNGQMGQVPPTLSSCSSKRRLVENFSDYYLLLEKVGVGASGSVSKASCTETGNLFAVKCMSSSVVRAFELQREADIMATLCHPNIAKIIECLEDSKRTYIIMELCEGGELLHKVAWTDGLPERQVAVVMRQVFSAIDHMHSRCVCHRDVKPENFLFLAKGNIDQSLLKTVDFGLSCIFRPGEPMTKKVGTSLYMAPEVLLERYYHTCDLWSCGCLMYVLCSGSPPFMAETDDKIFKKVLKGKWCFPRSKWGSVSVEARGLISKLIHMRHRERLSAEQALAHPWFQRAVPMPSGEDGSVLQPGRFDRMCSLNSVSTFTDSDIEPDAPELKRSGLDLRAAGHGEAQACAEILTDVQEIHDHPNILMSGEPQRKPSCGAAGLLGSRKPSTAGRQPPALASAAGAREGASTGDASCVSVAALPWNFRWRSSQRQDSKQRPVSDLEQAPTSYGSACVLPKSTSVSTLGTWMDLQVGVENLELESDFCESHALGAPQDSSATFLC